MPSSEACINGRPGRSATFQNDSAMPSAEKRPLHEVIVAYRRAAGGHQHIYTNGAGVPDRRDGGVEPIRHHAEIEHFCALVTAHRCQSEAT
jgi:hypothetical protein